ncbi:adenine phosphoribosyltransferase [Westerdykella ornata]|uniref:adenine phosphoribosyltransferase n=1 Tax=Westerdykella ornata TaxID=318751 RepID=A0A6A6J9Y0_WESOR|nr:adenine phosphoribosyltransferase [Westerdykella ornata]KAF2273067.1 adenine phosphoribosyltransferase [Westerdykella ornata]
MSGLAHTRSHPNDSQAAATGSHPPAHKPDPTVQHAAQGGLSAASASSPSQQPDALNELESLKLKLKSALRQFPDFPSPGILFEDILPIFADPALHDALVRALELHVSQAYEKPDVIVGLEARGFLFGPSLALRLGVGFAPVRKKGKLPGPCETAGYQKEYGEDFFQIQADAIKPGQKVLIVDDIIATGGSAAAAGALVKKLGGQVLGYAFLLELDFLKGRAKLDARVDTLLTGQMAKE